MFEGRNYLHLTNIVQSFCHFNLYHWRQKLLNLQRLNPLLVFTVKTFKLQLKDLHPQRVNKNSQLIFVGSEWPNLDLLIPSEYLNKFKYSNRNLLNLSHYERQNSVISKIFKGLFLKFRPQKYVIYSILQALFLLCLFLFLFSMYLYCRKTNVINFRKQERQ